MAKRTLTSMSVEALLKLRSDIGDVLRRRADELKSQLARLGGTAIGRGRGRKVSALSGRKVAPKYRDRTGNTWSGRGAQPRWMAAAIKAGAKRDDFLIDRSKQKKVRKVPRPKRKK